MALTRVDTICPGIEVPAHAVTRIYAAGARPGRVRQRWILERTGTGSFPSLLTHSAIVFAISRSPRLNAGGGAFPQDDVPPAWTLSRGAVRSGAKCQVEHVLRNLLPGHADDGQRWRNDSEGVDVLEPGDT